MDYKGFTATARSYLKGSDEAQLNLMRLLLDVEATPRVWGSKHKTWYDVLRAERFCTVSRYEAFKRAVGLGLDVKRLGVEAACLLARYSKADRAYALERTEAWITAHRGVRPTYQLVAEYVKGQRTQKPAKKTSLAALRAYIKTLQKLCTEHGIVYPEEPK